MVVGVLQLELTIEWSQSLKDKRRVVLGLKDRLHREYLVSVAEVARLDDMRVAVLGVAVVSGGATQCRRVIDRVLEKVRGTRDCVLSDHTVEMIVGH